MFSQLSPDRNLQLAEIPSIRKPKMLPDSCIKQHTVKSFDLDKSSKQNEIKIPFTTSRLASEPLSPGDQCT